MKGRIYIRMRSRSLKTTLPVPRAQCPVCNTLDRIQKDWKKVGEITGIKDTVFIRRGGVRGSCGYCQTEYNIVINKTDVTHRYEAVKLHKMVRDKLANYWVANRKGKQPKILTLEVNGK